MVQEGGAENEVGASPGKRQVAYVSPDYADFGKVRHAVAGQETDHRARVDSDDLHSKVAPATPSNQGQRNVGRSCADVRNFADMVILFTPDAQYRILRS